MMIAAEDLWVAVNNKNKLSEDIKWKEDEDKWDSMDEGEEEDNDGWDSMEEEKEEDWHVKRTKTSTTNM